MIHFNIAGKEIFCWIRKKFKLSSSSFIKEVAKKQLIKRVLLKFAERRSFELMIIITLTTSVNCFHLKRIILSFLNKFWIHRMTMISDISLNRDEKSANKQKFNMITFIVQIFIVLMYTRTMNSEFKSSDVLKISVSQWIFNYWLLINSKSLTLIFMSSLNMTKTLINLISRWAKSLLYK